MEPDTEREKLVPQSQHHRLQLRWQAFIGKWQLGFYTALLLLSSVGNQIYFKRMTSAMPNYGWYLTQLSTFVYVPFFMILAGTGVYQHAKGSLLLKFAVMGAFDGVSGTLMVLGGVHTAGTMQVLLSQSVIPLTLACSVVMLRKKYHGFQYGGAAIIVTGIVIANMMDDSGDDASTNSPLFNVIFFLALCPAAFSSVFKEVAFRGFDGDLDVNVLQFWVAVFQFVTNFLATPVYTLQILGPQRVALSEMPNLIYGGSKCLFMLEDTITTHCGLPGEKECDHCHGAWIAVCTYLFFNLFYNIFTMLVIKHGSAALSFLVATLRMPLASLAFASPAIMGNEAVPLGPSNWVSLFVIILGLGVYWLGGQKQKRLLRRDPYMVSTTIPGDSPLMSPAGPESPSPPPRGFGLSEPLHRKPHKSGYTFAPLFSTAGLPTFEVPMVMVKRQVMEPRSHDRVRRDLYQRLGHSPLQSPQLRNKKLPSPRTSFVLEQEPRFELSEEADPSPHTPSTSPRPLPAAKK